MTGVFNSFVESTIHFLKLHSVTFLVKNYPKSIIEQVHNQSVFKPITLPYLTPIHSSI